MRTKIFILGLICFFIFAYCNSPADPEIKKILNPENPGLPVIDYFTATPDSIDYCQESILKWKVINANKVEIDNGIGEVALEGIKEITPTKTTTYFLTATNNNGQVQKSCTVKIAPWFLEPPTINYFTATPSQILWEESFVLSWHVSNASYWSIKNHEDVLWFESTRIDNPLGEHAFPMRPANLADWSDDVITTFTLTAMNDNGQVQESCIVKVLPESAID